MSAKTYLMVPYAQKDEVKALGAKWDPVHKKWYVSAGLDISLFSAWKSVLINAHEDKAIMSIKSASKTVEQVDVSRKQGVITYAIAKDFVAYNGDTPPWD